MNTSMKKQILLILGIACLLQPELFAMRQQTRIQKEAAVQRELRKPNPNVDTLTSLVNALPEGANKTLFMNDLKKVRAAKAPIDKKAALEKMFNDSFKVSGPLGDLPGLPADEEEGAPLQGQGAPAGMMVRESEEIVKTKAGKELAEDVVTVARVDAAKVNAAQMNYAAARMITNKLVNETDLGKNTKDAVIPGNAAIPVADITRMPARYQEFAATVNGILSMRQNHVPENDPTQTVDCLVTLKSAFDQGKRIFWEEVQEIYSTPALERAQIYYPSKFIQGWTVPANAPTKANFFQIFNVKVTGEQLINAIVDEYYDSTLMQLVRALDAIWIMFQADWRAKKTSNPWPEFQNAVWEQMKKELSLMQEVADASFYLVGFAFGADKRIRERSDLAWNNANGHTKRFFADIAQDAEISSYPMGRISNNTPQKTMLNGMPVGGPAFTRALADYFKP